MLAYHLIEEEMDRRRDVYKSSPSLERERNKQKKKSQDWKAFSRVSRALYRNSDDLHKI